jgi:hypothetical protein
MRRPAAPARRCTCRRWSPGSHRTLRRFQFPSRSNTIVTPCRQTSGAHAADARHRNLVRSLCRQPSIIDKYRTSQKHAIPPSWLPHCRTLGKHVLKLRHVGSAPIRQLQRTANSVMQVIENLIQNIHARRALIVDAKYSIFRAMCDVAIGMLCGLDTRTNRPVTLALSSWRVVRGLWGALPTVS